MLWTLQELRQKIRKITGMPEQNQIEDSRLNQIINRYWTTIFPSELKVREQKSFQTFLLRAGVETVDFPLSYLTPSPAFFLDGRPIQYFLNFTDFNQVFPVQCTSSLIAQGDGVTSVYNFSLGPMRVLRGTVFIYTDTQIITDSSDVNNAGSLSYDVLTGEGNVVFLQPPEEGIPISLKCGYMQFARPEGVLYMNEKFYFRPVPMEDYEVRFEGMIAPDLLGEGVLSIRPEWGDVICYGSALELFCETGNMEGYDKYFPQFKRYESVALSRTTQTELGSRSIPTF